MKQKIEGVIVFDANAKRYDFLIGMSHLKEDGHYISEFTHWIYVCDHTIEIDIPADFDTTKPQLDALDAKEKELKFQYKQALEHINVERNNLLALEN